MFKFKRLLIFLGLLGAGFFVFIRTNTPTDTSIISPIGDSFNVNTLGTQDHQRSFTVYGYLPYWTLAEAENFRMDILTDVSYFGIEIDAGGNFITHKLSSEGKETNNPSYWTWKNDPLLESFLIKAKNLGIRRSISIVSHNDDISTQFLTCESCWEKFYVELKEEMDANQLEDINLNFEYYDLVPDEIRYKFTTFAEFIKRKMRKDFPSGELVITAFADSVINQRITHIPSISKVADKIFIMAYDFHVTPQRRAAPVSPLGGAGTHAGYDIRTMLKDYLSYAPPQKLILGVPYYGFNWGEEPQAQEKPHPEEAKEEELSSDSPMESPENTSITQTYTQIMSDIEEGNIDVFWDELGQVPYYEYTDPNNGSARKVYFENEKSLEVKYRLIKEFDLAGVGIWALGYDTNRPELWELLEREFSSL